MAQLPLEVHVALRTDPLSTPVWQDVTSAYGIAVLTDIPAAFWRLDESSGTTAYDTYNATASNDGTYINTPSLAAVTAPTNDGHTAVTFVAASTEYVAIADSANLRDFSAITLECWYYLAAADLGTSQSLISKTNGAGGGDWQLRLLASNFVFEVRTTTGFIPKTFSTVTPPTDAWTHVVATFDATDWKLYINGTLAETQTDAYTLQMDTTHAAAIAARGDGARPYNGSLCNVAIYSYALSAARVGAHYAAATNLIQVSVESGSYRSGRPLALGPVSAGTMEVTIDDPRRWLEPDNSASPLYPYVRHGKRVRLLTLGTILWSGFIERVETTASDGVNQKTIIHAADGQSVLERLTLDLATVRDGFARTTSSGLGTADKGGDWTIQAGTWSTDPTRGAAITLAGAAACYAATVDVGSANVTMTVTINAAYYNSVTLGPALVFRASNSANLYFIGFHQTTNYIQLYKRVAGVNTFLASSPAGAGSALANGDVITVQVSTWSVRVLQNGTPVLHYSIGAGDQFNGATTTHGLGFLDSAGAAGTYYFDDFTAFANSFASQPTGTRIGELLDNVGWLAADRNLATGNYTMQALLGDDLVDVGNYLFAAITSGATSMQVLHSGIVAGQTLQLDSEQVFVTAVTTNTANTPDTITITRAVKGTAAAHSAGAVIYRVDVLVDTHPGDSPMSYLQAAADTEGTQIYVDQTGRVSFGSSTSRSTASASINSQATFGNGGGTAVPLAAWPARSSANTDTLNDVEVTAEGGAAQQAIDTALITTYGRYSYNLSTQHFYDSEALSLAKTLLNRNKTHYAEIRTLETNGLNPLAQAQITTREIGNRITLTWAPVQGGSSFSIPLLIEGYEHSFTPTTWRSQWQVSLIQRSSFWVLGDSVLSLLGQTTILA